MVIGPSVPFTRYPHRWFQKGQLSDQPSKVHDLGDGSSLSATEPTMPIVGHQLSKQPIVQEEFSPKDKIDDSYRASLIT